MIHSLFMIQPTAKTVYPTTEAGLDLYRVWAFETYPDLKHAIFTRHGGVSLPPFDTLNLSIAVGDDADAVTCNAHYACRAVGTSLGRTVSCHLVHGTEIIAVAKANQRRVMGQADGLITADSDVYLFMRFGDCVPLIFFDPKQRAVGLTHAGWRGTIQNAAGATVEAMVSRLGCQASDLIAVIGPSIGPCCYEVGSEVIAAAHQNLVEADRLFTANDRPNHAHFDLWQANHHQLVRAGVTQIIQSELCTACRTDQFFSHRAEAGRTGRFGVIIGLQEPATA